MALNGLDAAKVQEAYQTAQDEAGGWLLLKYTARDEVDLLARGNGGFSDASEAVAEYPDKSPLYGFLLYRRRKLLIKYIPEGTSRLLQARTTVHFQTVQDAFVHDAVLNATSVSDLNEATLSACCSLHTSLKSSSSSVHRQNLDGISESAEETSTLRGGATGSKPHSVAATAETERPPYPDEQTLNKSLPDLPAEDESAASATYSHSQSPVPAPSTDIDSIRSGRKRSRHDKDTSDLVSETNTSRAQSRAESGRKVSDVFSKPRPSTSDLLRSGLERLKPKAKLFARPATALTAKRPTSAGQGRQKLPEGLRIRRGDSDRPKTAKSQKSVVGPDSRPQPESKPSVSDLEELPPPPSLDKSENYFIPRKSVPSPKNHIASMAQPSLTKLHPSESSVTVNLRDHTIEENESSLSLLSPEKQRLMKALQLRKQQRLAQQKQEKSVENILITARVDSQPSNEPQPKADSGVALDFKPESTVKDSKLSIPPTTAEAVKAESNSKQDIVPEIVPKVREESSFAKAKDAPMDTAAVMQMYREEREEAMTLGKSIELAGKNEKSSQDAPLQPPPKSATREPSAPLEPPPKSAKRRTATTPIKTDFSKDADNDSISSDDSLFAELISARVEEATPVSLTNSISHSSPVNAPNTADARVAGQAVAAIMIRPGSRQTSSRQSSVSGTISRTQQIAEQRKVSPLVTNSTPSAKKTNVSSEIHKRIQRLAEHSSRESLPTSPPANISSPVDKSPFHQRDRPSTTGSQASFGHRRHGSRASSPARTEKGTMTGGSEYGGSSRTRHQSTDERRRPDAMSITAHIVRDSPAGSNATTNGVQTDFNKSKVVIEHQTADSKNATPNGRRSDRRSSFSSRPGSRESSLTSITRQSFEAGWKKLGRGRTEAVSPGPQHGFTLKPNQDQASEKEKDKEKMQIKAARIFKRVSGLSKKSGASDNADGGRDDDLVREPMSPQGQTPLSKIIVGDLNVQLPDTLLWKWRWVEIDVFGNIVLSSSKSNEFSISRGVAKKYHLSDFEAPYIPSIDREEIPNSIVLELMNGGALQIACEDTVAQAQVFKRLQDTHKVWSTPRNRSTA